MSDYGRGGGAGLSAGKLFSNKGAAGKGPSEPLTKKAFQAGKSKGTTAERTNRLLTAMMAKAGVKMPAAKSKGARANAATGANASVSSAIANLKAAGTSRATFERVISTMKSDKALGAAGVKAVAKAYLQSSASFKTKSEAISAMERRFTNDARQVQRRQQVNDLF